MFQSTRPQGARQGQVRHVEHERERFNPRARKGRDKKTDQMIDDYKSFNPRARKGRDFNPRTKDLRKLVSIHAPARGATRMLSVGNARHVCFNPRARKGRDKRMCFFCIAAA